MTKKDIGNNSESSATKTRRGRRMQSQEEVTDPLVEDTVTSLILESNKHSRSTQPVERTKKKISSEKISKDEAALKRRRDLALGTRSLVVTQLDSATNNNSRSVTNLRNNSSGRLNKRSENDEGNKSNSLKNSSNHRRLIIYPTGNMKSVDDKSQKRNPNLGEEVTSPTMEIDTQKAFPARGHVSSAVFMTDSFWHHKSEEGDEVTKNVAFPDDHFHPDNESKSHHRSTEDRDNSYNELDSGDVVNDDEMKISASAPFSNRASSKLGPTGLRLESFNTETSTISDTNHNILSRFPNQDTEGSRAYSVFLAKQQERVQKHQRNMNILASQTLQHQEFRNMNSSSALNPFEASQVIGVSTAYIANNDDITANIFPDPIPEIPAENESLQEAHDFPLNLSLKGSQNQFVSNLNPSYHYSQSNHAFGNTNMQLTNGSNYQLQTQKHQIMSQMDQQRLRQSLLMRQQQQLDESDRQRQANQRQIQQRDMANRVPHMGCGPNPIENHDNRQNRLLHLALCCANPNPDLVRNILRFDRDASSRRHNIYTLSSVWCPMMKKVVERRRREPYTYAINLALYKKVNISIILMLIESAPHVMSFTDGIRNEHSLSILLRSFPNDMRMVDLFLLTNPNTAKVCDKFNNSPLHVACTSGSSLSMVKHIFAASMDSVFKVNMHGDTPYDVAVRNHYRCSEDVVDFLKSKMS